VCAIDPEGVETRAIRESIDFAGKDVLEIVCGEGRMTWWYGDLARSGAGVRGGVRACGRVGCGVN